MIITFTDFGHSGPYLGQMRAAIWRQAPALPVVDLFADVPPFNPRAGAYLLAAYAPEFPPGAVFLCVVDPGVGGRREPIMLHADGRWFVGPGNGLLSQVAARAAAAEAWRIDWRPERLSASFHGRDLFAPIAARLAQGEIPEATRLPLAAVAGDWPADWPAVIYLDHYGNAMTGMREAALAADATLRVKGHRLGRARTFSDVAEGTPFWYVNANGLVEVAVNKGRAADLLGLAVGDPIELAV
jgi:S-adenosylmethionine hydrolase